MARFGVVAYGRVGVAASCRDSVPSAWLTRTMINFLIVVAVGAGLARQSLTGYTDVLVSMGTGRGT